VGGSKKGRSITCRRHGVRTFLQQDPECFSRAQEIKKGNKSGFVEMKSPLYRRKHRELEAWSVQVTENRGVG